MVRGGVSICVRSILAEIYLCHACSCHEINIEDVAVSGASTAGGGGTLALYMNDVRVGIIVSGLRNGGSGFRWLAQLGRVGDAVRIPPSSMFARCQRRGADGPGGGGGGGADDAQELAEYTRMRSRSQW
jgi:hypothetical protein